MDMDRAETVDSLYLTQIEHAGMCSHGLQEYGGGFMPPTLHIGILPTNTFNVNGDDETKIASVVAMWSCRTVIDIEYSFQNLDTNLQLQPFNSQYLINKQLIKLGSNTWNFRGYTGFAHGEKDGTTTNAKVAKLSKS